MIRRVYVTGAALTALWLFLVWFYVDDQVGWETIFYLLPTEIALFFAAVTVPLAFLWLIVAYTELSERHRINRETLIDLAQRMAETAPKARQEAKALSAEINKQIENFSRLEELAASTRIGIKEMGTDADKALKQATERTAADSSQIRQTYEAFVADISQAADETAARLRKTIETSIEASFSEDLKSTVAQLDAESDKITNASSDFAKRLESVEALLDGHREKLSEATSRAATEAGKLDTAFDAQIQSFDGAAEHMSKRVAEIHDAVEQQIARLKEATEAVSQQVTALDSKAGSAAQRVAAIGADLHKMVDKTIDEELLRVGESTEEVGQKIKGLAEHAGQGLDSALADHLSKMESAAAKLDEDIGALNSTMNESMEHLDTLVKTTAKEAHQTVDVFHSQVEALSQATREASDQTEAVREAVAQGRRDAFLRASASVIRELNELAVEIDRVFEPSLPDNILKLYEDGDHGIFVRRIARSKDEHSVPLIRERMRKDSGFRHNVNTFMKRYESLLAQTTECDPDRILTATFLTADVGKVYMLLTRANQRDH